MNPYSAPGHGPQDPYGPQGFYGEDQARQKLAKRLKTLAIVQLVFAALGLVGMLNSLVPTKEPMARRINEAMWSGDLGGWMRVSTGISLLFIGLLAAAGFSMLKQKPIARTLSLIHGIAALGFGLVSLLITRALLGDTITKLAKDLGPAGEIFKTTFQVALVFGFLFGAAMQLLEIWVVTRPGVKELLERSSAPPPYG